MTIRVVKEDEFITGNTNGDHTGMYGVSAGQQFRHLSLMKTRAAYADGYGNII